MQQSTSKMLDKSKINKATIWTALSAFIAANKDTRYFICIRDDFNENSTLGKLYLSDNLKEMFCYTLEDQIRPKGEKIHGETAIPENLTGYDVDVAKSPKFGEVVTLYTSIESGVYKLEYNGVSFDYIRVHGGNDESDTEGCPLVARYRSTERERIQGSMKNEVKDVAKNWLSEGYFVKWLVINLK